MEIKLHKNKFKTRLLLTFTTMVIGLLSFMIGAIHSKVYAAAPAGYYDLLEAGGSYVMGQDLDMTLYIEDNTEGEFSLIDGNNNIITINGGGFSNFPLVKSVVNSPEIYIEMWDGTSYFRIHRFDAQSDFSEMVVTGNLTLGAWAYGKTITVNNECYSPFIFSKSLSTGGPVGSTPVLNGWEGVYVTNVNSPVSLATLKGLVSAIDDEDGDVTSSITITTDNYSTNMNITGLHEITFSVSDSNSNTATLTLYVKVVDVTIPVINGASSFNSNMSNPLTVNDIKSTFTVSDNYDSLTASNIVVRTDNFTTNKMTKGSYTVVYEVLDNSGNKGVKSVTVNVIDDIKPVITGNTSYTKGQDAILSLDTIKAGLSATDNVDGNVTASIVIVEDKFSSKGTTVGSWTIKYQATDSSGNKSALYTVTINVTDTMPPVFFVDESIISIDSSLALTQQDILDLLAETGQLNLSMAFTTSFVIDDYQGSQDVGSYPMSVKVDYADGTTQLLNLTVNVVEQTFTSYPTSKWFQSWHGWKTNWFGIKFIYDGFFDVLDWVKDKVNGLLSLLGIN